MGISVKRWLMGKLGVNQEYDFSVDFCEALQEYRIRELAFETCVNMIANAVGKCEFKTYEKDKEVKNHEYYTWNIEPNLYQNSTDFLHKLIYQLYRNNEALVVSDYGGQLVVADTFTAALENPVKEREYEGVVVGEYTYPQKLMEQDVLHIKLNQKDIQPVINGLYTSYTKLVQAAMKSYSWSSGKHYKVHIGQVAKVGKTEDGKDWNSVVREMLDKQVKPFLTAENGVLPENDGYAYEDMSGDTSKQSTRDIRALIDDIFDFTARGFGIPPVLLFGDVAGTKDAMSRWLTVCIDPLCDQLQEEINRKRYGFADWNKGNYLRIDTSAILHFDMFDNAANVEKLVGSGAFTVNDVRKAAGQTEIKEDWANEFFVTKNFAPVDEMMVKGGDKDGKNVGN